MKRYTVELTIGHNVKNIPTFTTPEICEYTADYLGIKAFTAIECVGMWEGASEKSTRIEICACDENEIASIRSNVPILAQALAQDSIMCEIRTDRTEFIRPWTIEEIEALEARHIA